MFKKPLSLAVLLCFLINSLGPIPKAQADSVIPAKAGIQSLPEPGTMVNLSPAYVPVLMKGLKVHPENPFKFDFIMDTGNSNLTANSPALKQESNRLIKYFLAALTVPEKDLWVNLSPYEKDRMIADNLGQTEMGRDMLAQDYVLKQLTASLIYPEKDLGKAFWDKVYAKAQQMYGSSEVPVNTFNKVWIVADKADIFERNNVAYVVGAHLKVMLEEDYTALDKNQNVIPAKAGIQATSSVASQIVKEIILPEIEREINEGKNFAPLRQMFYSMILASWFKMALKDSVLAQMYGNQGKVKAGVNAENPAEKEQIYQRYLQAYKKGVFNYIKEENLSSPNALIGDPNKTTIPRKYFSGGLGINAAMAIKLVPASALNQAELRVGKLYQAGGDLSQASATKSPSAAMLANTSSGEPTTSVSALATLPQTTSQSLQGKRVLVLDDNTMSLGGLPSFQKFIVQILMDAGAQVVFPKVDSGDQEIITALQDQKFDLILTNYWRGRHSGGGDRSGVRLAKMFDGTINANTPVMFTSASPTETIQAALGTRLPTGDEAPFLTKYVHLAKPFGIKDFMQWAVFMANMPELQGEPTASALNNIPELKALPEQASSAMVSKSLASGNTIVLKYPGAKIIVDAHTVLGKAELKSAGGGHLLDFDGNGKGRSGTFFKRGITAILGEGGNFENGKLVSFEIGNGHVIITNNIGYDIDITTDAEEVDLGNQALVPESMISLRGGNRVRFYEAATKLKYIFMAAGLKALEDKRAIQFGDIWSAVSAYLELIPGEQGGDSRVPGRFSRAEEEWPIVALNQFNQWISKNGIPFDEQVYMTAMDVIEHMRHADQFKNPDGAEEIRFSDILTALKADTQKERIIATAALKALATKFGLLSFTPDVSAAMTGDDVTGEEPRPEVFQPSREDDLQASSVEEDQGGGLNTDEAMTANIKLWRASTNAEIIGRIADTIALKEMNNGIQDQNIARGFMTELQRKELDEKNQQNFEALKSELIAYLSGQLFSLRQVRGAIKEIKSRAEVEQMVIHEARVPLTTKEIAAAVQEKVMDRGWELVDNVASSSRPTFMGSRKQQILDIAWIKARFDLENGLTDLLDKGGLLNLENIRLHDSQGREIEGEAKAGIIKTSKALYARWKLIDKLEDLEHGRNKQALAGNGMGRFLEDYKDILNEIDALGKTLPVLVEEGTDSPAMNALTRGGIDFDRAKMQMDVKRDAAMDAAQPMFKIDPAMIADFKKNGVGLEFTIETIVPITNLPLLLGLRKEEEQGLQPQQLAGV